MKEVEGKTKLEEAATGKEVSSTEAEGGFKMCEVEEQQAVSVEAQPQKRRAVIRVELKETQGYASERRRCGDPGQEEVEETGFLPSAVSEPPWALHMCGNAVSRASSSFHLRPL